MMASYGLSGWGATLRRLMEVHHVGRAIGLTLSDAQADFIEEQAYAGVTVQRDSWATQPHRCLYAAFSAAPVPQ
jgi:cyclopropane fatty-acyl-phospholipid synthase-like methyltransferase